MLGVLFKLSLRECSRKAEVTNTFSMGCLQNPTDIYFLNVTGYCSNEEGH